MYTFIFIALQSKPFEFFSSVAIQWAVQCTTLNRYYQSQILNRYYILRGINFYLHFIDLLYPNNYLIVSSKSKLKNSVRRETSLKFNCRVPFRYL